MTPILMVNIADGKIISHTAANTNSNAVSATFNERQNLTLVSDDSDFYVGRTTTEIDAGKYLFVSKGVFFPVELGAGQTTIAIKLVTSGGTVRIVPDFVGFGAGSPLLPTGAATQETLAAILAKIIAAPATEAKQDSIITLLTPTYHAPVGNAYEINATQTLAEITSAAIPAWVREVTLIPRSTGVFWSTSGDACLSTMLLPLGGISIPGTAASLATIELFAVQSTVVDIIFTGVSA